MRITNVLLSLLVMGLFFFTPLAFAGDGSNIYWVSTNGGTSWSACESSSPLSGTAACSLATANASAQAGDTVNFRAGTYTTQLRPANSGTGAGSGRIIFQAYSSEQPIIILGNTGSCGPGLGVWALELDGPDYIKIDGIDFADSSCLVWIHNGSNYNEITNCSIYGATWAGNGGMRIYSLGGNNDNGEPNTHNWLHKNSIYESGLITPAPDCDDAGGFIKLGEDGDKDTDSNYNTFEGNEMYWGAHHVIKVQTKYNVIRNNYIHNEGHFVASPECEAVRGCSDNGYFGNRGLNIVDQYGNDGDLNNLVENNRFGHMGIPSDGNGEGNFTIGSDGNIVRYNVSFNAMEAGYYFRTSSFTASDNRFYNNTSYHNGNMPSCARKPGTRNQGLYVQNDPAAANNVFKNNIFYDNVGADISDYGRNTHANNWCTNTGTYCDYGGDPLFVNTDISDPTSWTLPDLSLQGISAAIDAGTHLTQANGSGSSSTTLIVDDALYFQDGTWGSPLSDIQADWIALGAVDNVVQISSINYATNTITLDSQMTWSDNANIWLYKDSDGTKVLYGSAPDIGASESNYEGAPTISSATIGADGVTVTVVFSESVSTAGYEANDLDLDCDISGTDIGLSIPIGSPASSIEFTAASEIRRGDTCTIDFDNSWQSGDIVANDDSTDVESCSDCATVTNNSQYGGIQAIRGFHIIGD